MKGQCLLACIPVRSEPKSQAEIVTQALYGESYTVLEQEEDWLKVKLDDDNYEGWISEAQFKTPQFEPTHVQSEALFAMVNNTIIPMGGYSPYASSTTLSLKEAALAFLGSPYLWGGKTFMGIDCSGFVQTIFKVTGMQLPRDASQQIDEGQKISFDAMDFGDLAFFHNANGKITHVGLVLEPGRIIHAAGEVRIDQLTTAGIIHTESGKQTHDFHSLRRLR